MTMGHERDFDLAWLDLRSDIEIDLENSALSYFHASWRGKQDDDRNIIMRTQNKTF